MLLPSVGNFLRILSVQTHAGDGSPRAAGLSGVDACRYIAYNRTSDSACIAIVVAGAVAALRALLEAVGTEKAQFYRPHDLRRGHAEDLRLSSV